MSGTQKQCYSTHDSVRPTSSRSKGPEEAEGAENQCGEEAKGEGSSQHPFSQFFPSGRLHGNRHRWWIIFYVKGGWESTTIATLKRRIKQKARQLPLPSPNHPLALQYDQRSPRRLRLRRILGGPQISSDLPPSFFTMNFWSLILFIYTLTLKKKLVMGKKITASKKLLCDSTFFFVTVRIGSIRPEGSFK